MGQRPRRGKAAGKAKGRWQPTQGNPTSAVGLYSIADACEPCAKLWLPITVDGVEVELIVMPKQVEPGVSAFGKGPGTTEYFFVGDALGDEEAKDPLGEWWADTLAPCFGDEDNDVFDSADTFEESGYLNDEDLANATPLSKRPENGGTSPNGPTLAGLWQDGRLQQRARAERLWADTQLDEEDDIWPVSGEQLGTVNTLLDCDVQGASSATGATSSGAQLKHGGGHDLDNVKSNFLLVRRGAVWKNPRGCHDVCPRAGPQIQAEGAWRVSSLARGAVSRRPSTNSGMKESRYDRKWPLFSMASNVVKISANRLTIVTRREDERLPMRWSSLS